MVYLDQGDCILDNVVHLRDVDVGIPQRTREILVYLKDDCSGRTYHRLFIGEAEREGHVAILVGRSGSSPEDVGRIDLRLLEAALVQVVGEECDCSAWMGPVGVLAVIPGLVQEMPFHLGLQEIVVPHE